MFFSLVFDRRRFLFNLDLYLFLSLLYGTQVYSFSAILAICRLCFYNSKNLSYIGVLSFYDSKRSIGEVLFLNQFIGVIFEAGNETREKIWSDFGAEQKWRAERKESDFCSYRCLWESEKLTCEKIFSKRAKFFCSRAAF